MSKPKRNGTEPSPSQTKDGRLHIRATKASVERWREAAQRERRSLTNWIECVLDDAARGENR